jgi:Flp pilus assembly pilin Flp
METLLRKLALREDGQDLIEYALLASLLSVVSILALSNLGSIIRNESYLISWILRG